MIFPNSIKKKMQSLDCIFFYYIYLYVKFWSQCDH